MPEQTLYYVDGDGLPRFYLLNVALPLSLLIKVLRQ